MLKLIKKYELQKEVFMRIVIIGTGKVGKTIVGHASFEGHEVIVIDKNPKTLDQIVEQYDVIGVCGNAKHQYLCLIRGRTAAIAQRNK